MRIPNVLTAARALWRAATTPEELIVSEADEAARLSVCEACPYFDHTMRQCNECTCFVDLKAKLSTEECPKGFWPKRLTRGRTLASFFIVWQTMKTTATRLMAKFTGR